MQKPQTLEYASLNANAESAELAAYRGTLLGQTDLKLFTNPWVRRGFYLLVLLILVIASVQFCVKITEVDVSLFRSSGERHRTALGRWLPTAGLIFDNPTQEDPYGYGHWFPTPPMMLLMIAPLSKLGFVGAGIVWSLLKLAGFAGGMMLIINGMNRDRFQVPVGVLIMAAVYSLRPVVGDITHGNLNIFMMVWLAIAWGAYIRRKEYTAGLFVALAVATKLTPALVVVYFAYKREWRVLAGALVGLLLFFIVIPGLMLGFETNWDYLKSWFDMLVAPFALQGYAANEPANQSLFGVLMRLFSNAGILKIEHMSGEMSFESGMEDMSRPATALGRLLKPAITLPILAVLAYCCRTRVNRKERGDPRLLLEFSLVLLAMLLMSERTWKHHATTLPIVFLAIWFGLTCRPLTDQFRKWFVAGLVGQLVLLVILSEGILPERIAEQLLDGGIFCWGLLLCFVQTAILIRAIDRLPPAAVASP